ncbi:MAG TPA: formylglycine-generating enzyme family protein [Candidatus Binatia bacterium]
MAKKNKSRSSNRAADKRPRTAVSRVEQPTTRSEPIAAQNQRLVYAGAAAVLLILVTVIWFVVPRSREEPTLQPFSSGSKWLDQASEPAISPAAPSEAISPQSGVPDSAQRSNVLGARAKVFRDRLKSGGEGPEMVPLEAGAFRMGDIEDGRDKAAHPVRLVKIQKPLAMGRYEVTFEDYDKFAQATGRQLPNDGGGGRGRQPVINFSWKDAVEYGKWLSAQTGKRYRLPSEAEWEYAARGGAETNFWWGNQMKSGMANCIGCGSPWDNKVTAPVGSFPPNPFGLYDTAGNLWEWVEDCDHDDYKGAPTDGSAWKKEDGGNCYLRVFRGGAWNYGAQGMRSSFRGRGDPDNKSAAIGFRLVRELK